MKKRFTNLNIFGMMVLVLSAFTMVAAAQDQGPQTDLVSQKTAKLEKELKLDESQTSKVRAILEKAGKKATADRETFKTDALQLIAAARERLKTVKDQISQLLKPEQQETFRGSGKLSRLDRELFTLTEGLLLDDDQAFTVDGVLIDFHNRFEEMMPQGWVPPSGSGMGRIMGQFQNRKNSKIRRILSKNQRKLFSQILKDQKKKMKERLKKMKERWKKNRK